MQYRSDRYGNKISALGYGCMRFTQSGGKVDVAKAEKEIMEAYRGGVNYFLFCFGIILTPPTYIPAARRHWEKFSPATASVSR